MSYNLALDGADLWLKRQLAFEANRRRKLAKYE